RRKRLTESRLGLCSVDALAVPEQDVLRSETGECLPRRQESQEWMDAEDLPAREAEIAGASQSVAADEYALLSEPECDLAPEATATDRAHLERRACDAFERRAVQLDPEPLRHGGTIAAVPIEELDDAGGSPEGLDPLLDLGAVESVDHPDPTL